MADYGGGRGRDNEATIYGQNSEETTQESVETVNLHVNIAEHLREGKELIVSSEHAFRVVQVLHAARESGASGKSVDVMI